MLCSSSLNRSFAAGLFDVRVTLNFFMMSFMYVVCFISIFFLLLSLIKYMPRYDMALLFCIVMSVYADLKALCNSFCMSFPVNVCNMSSTCRHMVLTCVPFLLLKRPLSSFEGVYPVRMSVARMFLYHRFAASTRPYSARFMCTTTLPSLLFMYGVYRSGCISVSIFAIFCGIFIYTLLFSMNAFMNAPLTSIISISLFSYAAMLSAMYTVSIVTVGACVSPAYCLSCLFPLATSRALNFSSSPLAVYLSLKNMVHGMMFVFCAGVSVCLCTGVNTSFCMSCESSRTAAAFAASLRCKNALLNVTCIASTSVSLCDFVSVVLVVICL